MKRIAIAAFLVGGLGLGACGNSSSDDVIDAYVDDDGGGDGGPTVACDLIENTGCAPEEKCTFIIDEAGPPVVGHTGCAPEGVVGEGQECLRDETGADNCEAGLLCNGQVCERICTVAPDDCPEDFTCVHVTGVFEDNTIGTCDPACDLWAQDCSNEETCYILLGRDGYPTVCAPAVPEPPAPDGCGSGSEPGTLDDCCSHPNTCAAGWGCTQLPDPESTSGLECAYYCDPTGTTSGPQDCNPPGPGPAPSYECIRINAFYTDVPDLPDSIGFCIRTSEWGPASCWNDSQDVNEDGVDCCDPGNPLCECIYTC
jgi:hypothetical protein